MVLPTQNRWESFSGVVPLCYVIKQEFSNHEMKSSLKFSADSFGSPSSPNPTFPLTLEMKKFPGKICKEELPKLQTLLCVCNWTSGELNMEMRSERRMYHFSPCFFNL